MDKSPLQKLVQLTRAAPHVKTLAGMLRYGKPLNSLIGGNKPTHSYNPPSALMRQGSLFPRSDVIGRTDHLASRHPWPDGIDANAPTHGEGSYIRSEADIANLPVGSRFKVQQPGADHYAIYHKTPYGLNLEENTFARYRSDVPTDLYMRQGWVKVIPNDPVLTQIGNTKTGHVYKLLMARLHNEKDPPTGYELANILHVLNNINDYVE